jgi:hypothetical protein
LDGDRVGPLQGNCAGTLKARCNEAGGPLGPKRRPQRTPEWATQRSIQSSLDWRQQVTCMRPIFFSCD